MKENLKELVTSVKKRMSQKLKSLLWSSVAIVISTSLSTADIFTSSSDLNSLLYSTSNEMLYLARQYQLALRVIKYIPLALHSTNTYKISIPTKVKVSGNQKKKENIKMQLVTLSLQGRLKVKILLRVEYGWTTKMEDDQNRKQPKWKTTKMEDDQNGRRPKWKTTKMEDDPNGRRPKWKTAKMEDDQNGRRPKWKTTKIEDDQNGRRPKLKTT